MHEVYGWIFALVNGIVLLILEHYFRRKENAEDFRRKENAEKAKGEEAILKRFEKDLERGRKSGKRGDD